MVPQDDEALYFPLPPPRTGQGTLLTTSTPPQGDQHPMALPTTGGGPTKTPQTHALNEKRRRDSIRERLDKLREM